MLQTCNPLLILATSLGLRSISRQELEFFDDPVFRQSAGSHRVMVLGLRSFIALMLGRARRCPRADGPDDGGGKSGQPILRHALGYYAAFAARTLRENTSTPRLWRRKRSSCRKNINFRFARCTPDVFSVGRARTWAARPRALC